MHCCRGHDQTSAGHGSVDGRHADRDLDVQAGDSDGTAGRRDSGKEGGSEGGL